MKRKNIKGNLFKLLCTVSILGAIMILSMSTAYCRAKPVSVSINSVKANPGSQVKMEIKFDNIPDKGLTAAQFNIEYDKSKVTLKKDNIKSGSIVHNPMFDIISNDIDTGTTIIYTDYDMTGNSHIKSSGTFLELTFDVSSSCPSSYVSVKLTPTYELDFLNRKKENLFYTDMTVPVNVEYVSGKITVGNPKPEVKLTVDKPVIENGGSIANIDAAPKIIGGRTLLPIRAVVEAFDGKIDWNATDKKITISIGSSKIQMWINKKNVIVNNGSKTIDVPPQIIEGRTFVPVRFVSENAGLKVDWEASTKTITIMK
ncbi:stalk domain-containing protein [Pseudobacteroides cellulosolvens]|uniref:Copper amine oxidase-like domain-containing protein n=1 Tax=Pseudobacteroides cellulosolvens ATCC 35603 = DSM 2933 TaxID=398512 RepID=A0A0L6JP85_9FIRM|nr:stalk domain-containing protein [Pseudobacteroides cellulosolvens]KNY27651.1 copper amine oxidase-like domain-containing protein [Pseudobacteroides cellulosolvens ATCC 35603 = DSM 2933]